MVSKSDKYLFIKSIEEVSKNDVKGIIIVGDKESRLGIVQFENEDLDILSSLASQAGVALDNAELFHEITNARLFNESIMGSIATGVMTVNLMGEIDSINNAALRLFNKNKRNINGEIVGDIMAKSSELVIFRSSGISIWKILILNNDPKQTGI